MACHYFLIFDLLEFDLIFGATCDVCILEHIFLLPSPEQLTFQLHSPTFVSGWNSERYWETEKRTSKSSKSKVQVCPSSKPTLSPWLYKKQLELSCINWYRYSSYTKDDNVNCFSIVLYWLLMPMILRNWNLGCTIWT